MLYPFLLDRLWIVGAYMANYKLLKVIYGVHHACKYNWRNLWILSYNRLGGLPCQVCTLSTLLFSWFVLSFQFMCDSICQRSITLLGWKCLLFFRVLFDLALAPELLMILFILKHLHLAIENRIVRVSIILRTLYTLLSLLLYFKSNSSEI